MLIRSSCGSCFGYVRRGEVLLLLSASGRQLIGLMFDIQSCNAQWLYFSRIHLVSFSSNTFHLTSLKIHFLALLFISQQLLRPNLRCPSIFSLAKLFWSQRPNLVWLWSLADHVWLSPSAFTFVAWALWSAALYEMTMFCYWKMIASLNSCPIEWVLKWWFWVSIHVQKKQVKIKISTPAGVAQWTERRPVN